MPFWVELDQLMHKVPLRKAFIWSCQWYLKLKADHNSGCRERQPPSSHFSIASFHFSFLKGLNSSSPGCQHCSRPLFSSESLGIQRRKSRTPRSSVYHFCNDISRAWCEQRKHRVVFTELLLVRKSRHSQLVLIVPIETSGRPILAL